MTTPQELYQQWLALYDQGLPDQAMQLTAPDFVMHTPDGRVLARDAAIAFVLEIKGYVQQTGLKRKTKLDSLHAQPLPAGQHLIYARVTLCFTLPSGQEMLLPFVEVMQIGPMGILFDAFAKLADSQSFF